MMNNHRKETNEARALRLAEVIRVYWLKRGYVVTTGVSYHALGGGRAPVHQVTSSTANGWPLSRSGQR